MCSFWQDFGHQKILCFETHLSRKLEQTSYIMNQIDSQSMHVTCSNGQMLYCWHIPSYWYSKLFEGSNNISKNQDHSLDSIRHNSIQRILLASIMTIDSYLQTISLYTVPVDSILLKEQREKHTKKFSVLFDPNLNILFSTVFIEFESQMPSWEMFLRSCK